MSRTQFRRCFHTLNTVKSGAFVPGLLLLSAVFLNIFQDSTLLLGILGFWGSNLAVIPIALSLYGLTFAWLYKQTVKVSVVWPLVASYTIAVTTASLIFLPLEAHGTGLLFKAVSNAAGLILFLTAVDFEQYTHNLPARSRSSRSQRAAPFVASTTVNATSSGSSWIRVPASRSTGRCSTPT